MTENNEKNLNGTQDNITAGENADAVTEEVTGTGDVSDMNGTDVTADDLQSDEANTDKTEEGAETADTVKSGDAGDDAQSDEDLSADTAGADEASDINDGDDAEDDLQSDADLTEDAADNGEAADTETNKAGIIMENAKEHINKFFTKAKKPIIVTVLSFAAIISLSTIIGIAALPHNTVMHNVYVENTNLSGMTYDEALAVVNNTLLLENQTVTLRCGTNTYTINGSDIGITAKPEDTAKKAFNYGKSGNKIADGFRNAKNLLFKKVLIPVAEIDNALLDEKINEFGNRIYGEMIGHYVEINENDQTATIWPGHSGYDANTESSYLPSREIILESMKNDDYTNISVPLKISAPPDLTLEKFDSIVYTDPIDSYYKVENNTVEVVPEQTGRYINKDEAAELLPLVHEGGDVIKIPYYLSYAEITADTLNEKLFNATLGSYSTNYGGSTSNRKANVARAAQLINGTVVASGEVFSFNDTVGDRTVSNGFYTATEYVDGKSVQGIGGGTCQVSTTLYSAVLYADMQIVHRENHVMTVGYVPLGQDATVAYGSVDFKFKNSSDYPVKIAASADGGTIYVSIIGTAWEPPRKVEIKHSTSYIGADTLVHSTRYVYSNGELISTDPLSSSYYKPHTTAPPAQPENENNG